MAYLSPRCGSGSYFFKGSRKGKEVEGASSFLVKHLVSALSPFTSGCRK